MAGSWAMNEFQKVYSQISQQLGSNSSGSGQGQESQRQESQKKQEQPSEDATMKTANRISKAVSNKELSRKQKEKLGPVVHYGFGASMGALYGVAAEMRRDVTAGFGTAFSSVVFVGADEIAVPALGLSGSPTKAPLSTHVYAFASHLVYGLTTEGVRRAVRRML